MKLKLIEKRIREIGKCPVCETEIRVFTDANTGKIVKIEGAIKRESNRIECVICHSILGRCGD